MKNKISDDELFTPISWPECQKFMDKPGWEENSILISSGSLYDEYGDSAYLVRISWLDEVE